MKPVVATRPSRPLIWALFLLAGLLGGKTSPAASAAPANAAGGKFDPRLGAPFEIRDRPVFGSDKAPIVLVEIISFKCAHCRLFLERVYPQIREQYVATGKVQVVMINASDDPADASAKIFAIGRCLNRQGKLWAQMDFLFQIAGKPPSFYEDLIARNSAIDSDDLAFCLQDRTNRQLVAGDFAEYQRLEVQGTPTFFVRKSNGHGQRTETKIEGYQNFAYFQRVFDALLQQP